MLNPKKLIAENKTFLFFMSPVTVPQGEYLMLGDNRALTIAAKP